MVGGERASEGGDGEFIEVYSVCFCLNLSLFKLTHLNLLKVSVPQLSLIVDCLCLCVHFMSSL